MIRTPIVTTAIPVADSRMRRRGKPELLAAVAGSGAAILSAHTFVNSKLVRRPHPDPPSTAELVSVLIPARNEAHRIGPTISAILSNRGLSFEVIVLDDHSDDDTVDVVRTAAASDPRVRVVRGAELPKGWLGKPYACQQLGNLAVGSVLAFVDADVTLHPDALAASVALLREHDLALVSPYPKQIAVTSAERLVQPLLQWLWLTFLPLRIAERPRPLSMVAANGQLLVVDATAYREIGGHVAVANDVIEDVGMARAMKESGRRATVAEGSTLATCRMYESWSELRDGYSKSLWAALRPVGLSRAVGALLALVYLVPPITLVAGLLGRRSRLALIGSAGTLAAVAGRIVSARTTGGSTADAFAHPGSIVVLLWLGRRSHRLHESGRLSWKGRTVG